VGRQLLLSFEPGEGRDRERGRNSRERSQTSQAVPAPKDIRPAGAPLLEQVVRRETMNQAWRRIRANGGSPGVDGVTVDEFPAWMAERRDAVLRALGEGTYDPRLIRRFLRSGMMAGGLVGTRTEGTPQGGPLSPLLDEWDKELERRGHCFVRYADDCNIYVRSKRAGDRVLDSCRRFLAERLRLKVNAEKSAVDRPWKRSFLGYSVTNRGQPRLRIAPKSIQRMKQRVRELTRRTRGVSLKQVIADVATYLRGWLSYYRLAETPSVLRGLDAWLRRKLRCYVIKQKGRNSRLYGLLKSLGVRAAEIGWIATSSRGPWRMSRNSQVHTGLSARYFEARGLFSLHRQWSMLVKTT